MQTITTSHTNIWLGRNSLVKTTPIMSDLYTSTHVSIDLNKMFREYHVTRDSLALANSTKAAAMVRAVTRIVPYLRRAYTPDLNQKMFHVLMKEFIDHVFDRNIQRNRSLFGTTHSDVDASKVALFIQTPNTPLHQQFLTRKQFDEMTAIMIEQKMYDETGLLQLPEDWCIKTTQRFSDADTDSDTAFHVSDVIFHQVTGIQPDLFSREPVLPSIDDLKKILDPITLPAPLDPTDTLGPVVYPPRALERYVSNTSTDPNTTYLVSRRAENRRMAQVTPGTNWSRVCGDLMHRNRV